MSGLGTDVMALACILGSAAVGGVVTVAALDREGDGEVVCFSQVHEAPVVALSQGGDGQTIVVAPRVRVHARHGCEAVVVDVDPQVRIRLDEARLRMEEARARMDEARLRVDGEVAEALELRLREEMQRVERELARLEGRVVR